MITSWTHRPPEIRAATVADARVIAQVNVEAARAGWGGFIDPERLAAFAPPVSAWELFLAKARPMRSVLVAIYGAQVVGFVSVGPSTDADTDEDVGQVGALYTLPRVWRRGIGRLLLRRGIEALRQSGFREGVLWTEERNARPRRFYEQQGWRLDGARRERSFLGVPIAEVRYRARIGAVGGSG